MTAFAIVEGRTLAAAMKAALSIVETSQYRRTIPILQCVRVRTVDQARLSISGTDLDNHIEIALDVIDLGLVDFDICLHAQTLADVARLAGPATVRIEPDGSDKKLAVVTVADGDAIYSLQVLPAADFPEFPDRGGHTPIETFTNGRLASILDRTAGCISTEETRYYLNGVAWQISTYGRTITATDGHRLASCRYADYVYEEPLSECIIPRKTVAVLAKLSAGKDVQALGLTKDKTDHDGKVIQRMHLRFVFGQVTLDAKTIDGTFPDWRRVVPKEVPHALVFKADVLRTAIDRVATVSAERGRAVRIQQAADGTAHLTVTNPDTGSGHAKTFADWPQGSSASSLGFNAHYLRTAIGKARGDFTLRFLDAGAPAMVDDGDEEMTRVLMPMRV